MYDKKTMEHQGFDAMTRYNYELSRVMGMRTRLTVMNATSLPSEMSIVSMRGALVACAVSAKCFRGLHILSISRGILIFPRLLRWERFCSTSNSWCPSRKWRPDFPSDIVWNTFRGSGFISCECVFYNRFQQADIKCAMNFTVFHGIGKL